MPEKCECHECTQARWKSSLQYQIECSLPPQTKWLSHQEEGLLTDLPEKHQKEFKND
jgi:hypothetical protein